MDAQTLSLPISILNLNQPCTVEMGHTYFRGYQLNAERAIWVCVSC